MAKVLFDSWDVASKLGLEYLGESEATDKYGDISYGHNFEFHGKRIHRHEYMYDTVEEAKEAVADCVLLEIGKHLSKFLEDV